MAARVVIIETVDGDWWEGRVERDSVVIELALFDHKVDLTKWVGAMSTRHLREHEAARDEARE